MTKLEESAARADLIARARQTANLYVTTVSKGEHDTPERILYDAGSQSAKEMLAAYREKMDNFDTIPLDIEGNIIRLYRGEWSIVSGRTGTGKTTLLRQMVCHLLKAKRNVFVATLEQDPQHYIIELAATAAGVETPTESQLQSFLDTYGPQLKLWGMIGVADHRKILATVRDLTEAGLDYAIIDSLMMLNIDSKDIEEQRQFAALLSATVQAKGVHVILVAHPKKLNAEQEPSPEDVAGSSNLGNLAYNVMFIRRGPREPGQSDITPMELHQLKSRTLGRLGVITGCFYYNQRQFHLDAYATQPTFYLPQENYPATGLTDDMPEHLMNPGAFQVEREDIAKAPWEL